MPISIGDIYVKYYESAQKVERYSVRGGVYRHLFSLPYRLMKNIYASKYIKAVEHSPIPQKDSDKSSKIIISLTSFPQRIGIVHIVIKSLLLQKASFDKIVLWLSEDQFPSKDNDVPPMLLALKCDKFEIRYVPDNLMAHKKYYYAFQEFSDCRVVTVDDDLCYPNDLLERLIEISEEYPSAVCANVVRVMAAENGRFLNYRRWRKVQLCEKQSSDKFVAIGYGGVMYPPGIADGFDFSANSIKSLCFYADDLWLKGNEMSKGVSVATGGAYFPHPVVIKGTVKWGLQKSNMGKKDMNDEQWRNVVKHFNIVP
jgi:hypothetical protein